jgi:hypothetical protein
VRKKYSRGGLFFFVLLCLLCFFVGITKSFAYDIPETNPLFQTQSDDAYTWLKLQHELAKLDSGDPSGLVDSFEDFSGLNQPITEAFTYDQAVAAIAFLVKGDIDHAESVLSTLQQLQDPDGSWCNSYWYNGYWGAELRKHVGPAIWVALAVQNYEVITGDTTTYHNMAIKAIDWSLQFQKENGGVAGGQTTWDIQNVWTNEVWTGTEHNIDIYPALLYFASTTPVKEVAYTNAAIKVRSFLNNVVWDKENNRFYGGYKNDTKLVDPFVPLDVNPWSVMALGVSDGEIDYAASLDYIENASGDPITGNGTLEHPKYVYSLTYNDVGDLMTGYDFDWQSDHGVGNPKWGGGFYDADIWLEGSTFMAGAYYARGDDDKGDSILMEIASKLGTNGPSLGGLPYSLKGSNNNYWRMLQQNCVSSTGWFVIIAAKWNPFTASHLSLVEQVSKPQFSLGSGSYPSSKEVTITSVTEGATIRYTLDGSVPNETSLIYNGPITVSETLELKAIAYKDSIKASQVVIAKYFINDTVSYPTFNLKNGSYSGPQQVSISTSTNDAVIKYTIDGTVPNINSLTYTGPFIITEDITITAMAVRDGFKNSLTTRVNYVIQTPLDQPTFSVSSGQYNSAQVVSILSNESNTLIRYTVDGSIPTTESPIYTTPITISSTKTIKSFVQKEGKGDSEIAEATYTINSASFSAEIIETGSSATVYFNAGATWVDIHYKINNNGQQNVRMIDNPEKNYQEVIINNVKPGDIISYNFTYMKGVGAKDTEWTTYTIGTPPVNQEKVTIPVVSLASGTFTEKQSVTITCDTVGAVIKYIIDDNPLEVSVVYTVPITIYGTANLRVYATKEGFKDSDVLSVLYKINLPVDEEEEPIFVPNEPVDPIDPINHKDPIKTKGNNTSFFIIGGVVLIILAAGGYLVVKKDKTV